MLEKKRTVFRKARSAHRILWICSGLSTAGHAFDAFFACNRWCRAAATRFGQPDSVDLIHRQRARMKAAFRLRTSAARFLPNRQTVERSQRMLFSRTHACRFFFERPDLDPGLQPTRPHFLFCQTGFFNGRSDLPCPWPGRTSERFSQDACVIYLIKRDVYKIDSSSKRGCLLWIRPIFFTGSRVYALADVLNKACIALAPKVYRFRTAFIVGVSAHSLLWICMGLSTPCLSAGWVLPAGSSVSCHKKADRTRTSEQGRAPGSF